MIGNFLGMVIATVTFFGLIIPIWHWMSKSWKDAEQKGTNPYVQSFYGLFFGYLIGLTITGSILSIASFIGAPVKYYNCYFFTADADFCERRYKEDYDKAKSNDLLPDNKKDEDKDKGSLFQSKDK